MFASSTHLVQVHQLPVRHVTTMVLCPATTAHDHVFSADREPRLISRRPRGGSLVSGHCGAAVLLWLTAIVMLSLYRLSLLYGVMYGVPYRRRVIALPLDSHKSHSSAFACRMVKGIVDPNGSVQEESSSLFTFTRLNLIVSGAARVVPRTHEEG